MDQESGDGHPEITEEDRCWVLDDIALSRKNSDGAEIKKKMIIENFDSVVPSNWLFFPGGKVEVRSNHTMKLLKVCNIYFHQYILMHNS